MLDKIGVGVGVVGAALGIALWDWGYAGMSVAFGLSSYRHILRNA